MKTTFPVTAQTPANHHAMLSWNRAFTILELLAVVSFIGLLASLVLRLCTGRRRRRME